VEYYITMNTKTSLVFGIIAVAAAVLLFAAVPGVMTHQTWACGGGWGSGCFTFGGWSTYSYGGFVSSGGFGGW
jgi:hypothetical protein